MMLPAEGSAGSVVIVEDEAVTADMLALYFRREGFAATTIATLAEARLLVGPAAPDVLLIDVDLPDGSGLAFGRAVRRQTSAAIVYVTHHDETADLVRALEDGGDDYVTKPFDLRVLGARVRAVLRRRQAPIDLQVCVGPWMIDRARRELSRIDTGTVCDLTRGEFDLLAALAIARGATLSREYLLEIVSRRGVEAGPRTIDTLIQRIRRKLGDDAGAVVATVVGAGYRIASPVTVAP